MAATRKKSTRRASTARRRKPGGALTLLRADHREVQEMFDKFESRHKRMNASQKQALAEEICTALTVHAQIEEEIFYPAVREAFPKLADLLEEAAVEHGSAKDLIAQIEEGDAEDDHFDAMITVLGEYIKHHVREEQSELFPQLSESKIDLKELGERLEARKEELMSSGRPRTPTDRHAHL
jgi:hemerythrin-like domain-containing protein